MLISLSGHLWSMWQSKCVVYFKLVMDLSCIPLQWTNTVKQFQDWWTSIFWKSKKLPVFLRSRPMDLFCLDIVYNLYYWKQDKISGRSRVGGRGGGGPPLLRPNGGAEKNFVWDCPPPRPYLKVWICHWGYKLLLLIDCYIQVTCGEWVKQRRRPLSSSLRSSFTLFSSAKSFPRGGRGGWGQGYSHMKGVGMLVVSLRVFWAKRRYIKLQSLGHTQIGLL